MPRNSTPAGKPRSRTRTRPVGVTQRCKGSGASTSSRTASGAVASAPAREAALVQVRQVERIAEQEVAVEAPHERVGVDREASRSQPLLASTKAAERAGPSGGSSRQRRDDREQQSPQPCQQHRPRAGRGAQDGARPRSCRCTAPATAPGSHAHRRHRHAEAPCGDGVTELVQDLAAGEQRAAQASRPPALKKYAKVPVALPLPADQIQAEQQR